MIIREETTIGGVACIRTTSDRGVKVCADGCEPVDEAIDLQGSPWTYRETDIPVEEARHG